MNEEEVRRIVREELERDADERLELLRECNRNLREAFDLPPLPDCEAVYDPPA